MASQNDLSSWLTSGARYFQPRAYLKASCGFVILAIVLVHAQAKPVAESRVKAWKVSDFDDVINVGLESGRSFNNGRQMYGAGSCSACHRFKQDGSLIAPDLTSVGEKFTPRYLLESIIEPSKEISDQYRAIIFTKKDGSEIIGRVVKSNKDNILVNVNMLKPSATVSVDRSRLKGQKPSPISMMMPDLIDTLSKDDVLDLLAYLLSQGDPDDPMFQ